MSIDFSRDRWEKIREDARLWWAGKLKRPLIQVILGGRDPGRPEPKLPAYHRTARYGFSVSPEEIVDRWDYDLSRVRFLGDAFPAQRPDFGPGVVAVFVGAAGEVDDNTVWFHPKEDKAVSELRLECEPENVWFKRIADIYRVALERWEGRVLMGMTDLGGAVDILSTFRPGEKLLLDLYDEPAAVKRVTWQIHDIWFKYFDEFNAILFPTNPGYSAWTHLYSEVPYYMLQCDFCYMIGPEMFDEFVKPELTAACKRLTNPFYHLDGPGALPHLDSLLSIKELKGVQWVPGAGQPDVIHWPEVYRRIRKAGKLIQLWGAPSVLDTLAEQLGSAEGICFMCGGLANEKEAKAFLAKYGAL